jgi:DNA mismatch repair protein MutL
MLHSGAVSPENKIHVLDDHVANQIAAGEVVERPASVVKELVENALDAGATRIQVLVEDGGKRLIRVIDNGCGMTAGDAVLSLQRHATSKILNVDDLRNIISLGFRGEALPSIRSVSRFSLSTRKHTETEGVRIVADGAMEPLVEPAGGHPGTEVIVRDLFYNTPARQKFLRRGGTEMSRITETLDQFALGWPGVQFTLTNNGRVTSDYPADTDLRSRILSVMGKDVCKRLYPIRLTMSPWEIQGFLSEPTFNRANRRGLYCFINGRFIRDRVVQHAISQAYGDSLERGRHPAGVLYLSHPADGLDVNVHPAKAEVRFSDSGRVHGFITRAVKLMLSDAPWAHYQGNAQSQGMEHHSSWRPLDATPAEFELPFCPQDSQPHPPLQQDPFAIPSLDHGPDCSADQDSANNELNPLLNPADPSLKNDPSTELRFLAQVAGRYLVCQSHDAIQIVDPHAAEQQLLFRQLQTQFSQTGVSTQRLLFPLQVTLETQLSATATRHSDELRRMGFFCEHFGGNDWIVSEVPHILAEREPLDVLKEVLSKLKNTNSSELAGRLVDSLLAIVACAGSIRPGDVINPEAAQALLQQLNTISQQSNCLHGGPIMVTFSFSDVAKWFHQT